MAVNRTARAIGRISRLIVSIVIKIGISKIGVPMGSKWLSAVVGLLRKPISTVASQRGKARARFSESWVVGVKVYGSSPIKFNNIKYNTKVVKSIAHLWPL